MNKQALIRQMSESADLTRKQAEAALDAFIQTVTDALKSGDRVQIIGFGAFELRRRAEHQGLNPSTREPVTVKASCSPAFKPAKAYKEEFE